jgi:hypothetical protein
MRSIDGDGTISLELLSDLEIAIGVIASASGLSGFVIAYHVFARSFHFEERARYDIASKVRDRTNQLWQLWWRGLWLE